MLTIKSSFTSFSIDDMDAAKKFYSSILGLEVTEQEGMGISITLPGGGTAFAYPKKDHEPATFTVLNFGVEDIDQAVDALAALGVQFEQYDGDIKTDEKGISRSDSPDTGPDIAWFKDPSGNILSVVH